MIIKIYVYYVCLQGIDYIIIFLFNQILGVEVDDNCIQLYIKFQFQYLFQFIIYWLLDDKKCIIVDKIGLVGKWGNCL